VTITFGNPLTISQTKYPAYKQISENQLIFSYLDTDLR